MFAMRWYIYNAKCASERTVKICQYLMKL